MPDSVYRKLQEHLNQLPMGFPPTESGVEIALLKKMFEPLEAKLALALTPAPQRAEQVAPLAGLEAEACTGHLDRMGKRGLLITTAIEGERHSSWPLTSWGPTSTRSTAWTRSTPTCTTGT